MERLDHVVDHLLTSARYRPAVPYLAFWGWADMVGTTLARHTRPWKVSGHTLVVAATSGPWASELFMLRGELLGRLANRLGKGVVTELRIVARTELPPAEDPTETWPELRSAPLGPPPPEATQAAAQDLDQLLRSLVERAVSKGGGHSSGQDGE
ncbi:MAG: DUF721 domain-containing protein [Sulfobacillus sp.]